MSQNIGYLTVNGQLLIPTAAGTHIVPSSHEKYREIVRLLENGTSDINAILTLIRNVEEAKTLTVEVSEATVKALTSAVVKDEKSDAAPVPFEKSDTKRTVKITFENDYVFFGDYELPTNFGKLIRKLYTGGVRDFGRFELFLGKLFSNPTRIGFSSVLDFITAYDLTITETGNLIAYKSVGYDHWSSHGNSDTVVKSGKVNERGQIFNVIGEEIRVDRDQVDMNRHNGCSYGLHVGSHGYASKFSSVLMVVEVNPADICCVPHELAYAKVRCCAYTPVSFGDKKGAIASVYADVSADEDGKAVVKVDEKAAHIVREAKEKADAAVKAKEDDAATLSRIELKIKKYVTSKGKVTLRQVKAACPREDITNTEILNIVQKVGFLVVVDAKHITNTTISVG